MPLENYQVKQAIAHMEEHLTSFPLYDDKVEFLVELSSQNDNIVRARFFSGHKNNKNHTALMQFKNKYTEHPINGWYCACMPGERDIGCCVHVTALLWRLSVRRAEILIFF